jgi:hypothetical protein
MGAVRLLSSNILAVPSLQTHSIILQHFWSCLLCHLLITTMKYVPIPAIIPSFMHNVTLRLIRMIPNDILCIWSSKESLEHSSGWLMGYFQYSLSYSVIVQQLTQSGRYSAPALPTRTTAPPQNHPTESANNLDCIAALNGGLHSGFPAA